MASYSTYSLRYTIRNIFTGEIITDEMLDNTIFSVLCKLNKEGCYGYKCDHCKVNRMDLPEENPSFVEKVYHNIVNKTYNITNDIVLTFTDVIKFIEGEEMDIKEPEEN